MNSRVGVEGMRLAKLEWILVESVFAIVAKSFGE